MMRVEEHRGGVGWVCVGDNQRARWVFGGSALWPPIRGVATAAGRARATTFVVRANQRRNYTYYLYVATWVLRRCTTLDVSTRVRVVAMRRSVRRSSLMWATSEALLSRQLSKAKATERP